MRTILRPILLINLFLLNFLIFSQDLFWADKEIVSSGVSFFSTFKSSDNLIYSSWLEVTYSSDGSGGVATLVIRKSPDGYNWENINHNIPPVEFFGVSPVQNYSIDSDSSGNLILSWAYGETGAYNNVDIYSLKSGENELALESTLNYDRAVLSPQIYYRGADGELGYILFTSQLKELNSEQQEDDSFIELESGAFSIFYRTSRNLTRWSQTSEFINNDSDQSGLPVYRYIDNRDIVIYQSVVTFNNENNNFQLFIKYLNNGDINWSEDTLLTGTTEYVTGRGNQEYTAFDNQRPSFFTREGNLGITWERSYGYESPKIYYGNLIFENNNFRLVNSERITAGSRSCSRPKGFEFNNEFYLLWFDNQFGSNDIVMAKPDSNSGLWLETTVSDDRTFYSVFGDFIKFQDTLRIIWEDQIIDRNRYNQSTSRIVLLNPDNSVNAPVIFSNYKERDNRTSVRFNWSRPVDSSGIKGFYYRWSDVDGNIITEDNVLSTVQQSQFLPANSDGQYIFEVYAEDNAGNISDISKYQYTLDITPPNRVIFPEPRTDEDGYLLSNSERIIWDTLDDDVAGFSRTLTFLGSNYNVNDFDIENVEKSNNYSSIQSITFDNYDNGYYALTVRAIDVAGNIGEAEAYVFKLNKYIPVTYISYVNYTQSILGDLVTTIHGRGFKADGDVNAVILDRDGVEPWDYYFENDPNVFRVVSDIRIEGPNLDIVEEGTYRVGIIHPVRGMFFSNPVIRVESTGTVKFGDFTKGYEDVWQLVKPKKINISFELLIFILTMASAFIISLISVFKLISITKERNRLYHDAKALHSGTPFLSEKEILRIRNMEKHGFGLRLKFTVLIISLVIGIIVLISFPLGNFMINTQKKNLTDGLVSRTEILLNSLVSAAKDYIQRSSDLDLANLIRTTEAMPEVMWGSIVGVSQTDSEITNAIWAYTDEVETAYYIPLPENIVLSELNDNFRGNITEEEYNLLISLYNLEGNLLTLKDDISFEDDINGRKILTDSGYPREINIGSTPYMDFLDSEVSSLIQNIESKGDEDLREKKEELVRLRSERINSSGERAAELDDLMRLLNNQITDALNKMASNTGEYPAVDYMNIQNEDYYIFYKPILYDETGVETFYKGMVRLKVSTDTINEEITRSIQNLIIRVAITAVVAILIGFIGALIMATFMINPIKRLVSGVQVIRDTDDKAELKNHEIVVKSKDELFTLATTVNQMTEGLVKAAAMSKDVTMGKEIQKMFIPLESNPSGEGKLTTGEFENDYISLFGYYEGAKGVSGDYFDYKQLDDDHFAFIKCDIAGKGVPASLIMVEVATIFLSYFRKWSVKKEGYHLENLVYSMNDLLEERGFKGRFAALIVVILNVKTGKCYMCNAGDNLVHIYRDREEKMETMVLHEVPAAGIFSSDLLEMQGGYKVETTTLRRNDILFLFTDGVEESKHLFRDENYNEIICQHPGLKEGELHDTHALNEEFEELGVPRINEIIHSIVHKEKYSLKKYHYPDPSAEFIFDFSTLTGEVKEAVLGLIAVEKIFRLNPDPSASKDDVIKIDKVVNYYLLKHFEQYSDYFKFKADKDEDSQHNFFSHIKEDDQYDDLTILGIKKK